MGIAPDLMVCRQEKRVSYVYRDRSDVRSSLKPEQDLQPPGRAQVESQGIGEQYRLGDAGGGDTAFKAKAIAERAQQPSIRRRNNSVAFSLVVDPEAATDPPPPAA